MHKVNLLSVSCFALVLATGNFSTALAQEAIFAPADDSETFDEGITSQSRGAVIFRSDSAGTGGRIFGADSTDALTRQLSANRGGAEIASSLVEKSSGIDRSTGEISAWFEQRINGLKVYGAYAKTVLSDSGELLFSASKLVSPSKIQGASPAISASQALKAVLKEYHPAIQATSLTSTTGSVASFDEGEDFFRSPTVETVYFEQGNFLNQGYLVETWSKAGNELFETLVDGSGNILANASRTNSDRIRFYPQHPDARSARTRNTPNRWTSGTQHELRLRGPNAVAIIDRIPDNVPDALGRQITDGEFVGSANLSQEPTTRQNQRAAIQNLGDLNRSAQH